MSKKSVPDRDAAWIDPQGRPTPSFLEYIKDLDARALTEKVSVTAPTNGQFLVYNSSTGLYEPTTLFTRSFNTVAAASLVSLTSGVDKVWNQLDLPAGRWWVGGNAGVLHQPGQTPTFQHMHADHNASGGTTIQGSPADGITVAVHLTSNDPNGWMLEMGQTIYTLAAPTTINAVMQSDFTGGTAGAYGTLWGIKVGI